MPYSHTQPESWPAVILTAGFYQATRQRETIVQKPHAQGNSQNEDHSVSLERSTAIIGFLQARTYRCAAYEEAGQR